MQYRFYQKSDKFVLVHGALGGNGTWMMSRASDGSRWVGWGWGGLILILIGKTTSGPHCFRSIFLVNSSSVKKSVKKNS
jgi:hypothetical protein